MITKKRISTLEIILWSRRSLLLFLVIAVTPVILYHFFHLHFLHLPWTPIAVLGTAVAFVIGFKNSASYDRLWEARKIWGGIVNTSRSFGIMTRDFINNNHTSSPLSDEELNKIKRKIINRHIAWMAAHRYALRASKPWEDSFSNKNNLEFMERHGHVIPEKQVPLKEALSVYLEEDELEYVLSKNNIATTLISLQSKHLAELRNEGYLWEFSQLELENILVEFYALQGKNERIKNFPYPRQFATLNFAFVWIFILLLPFGVMSVFDAAGADLLKNASNLDSMGSFMYRNFIWLSVPFCMVLSWVFWSLEKVGETMENPFEGMPSDIPITSMSRGIEIDLLDMFDETDIPDKIPEINNVQM
ncbi:MAG: hypothetical protein HRT58_08470 [Crocinitomicaceae bacterium]|nr:hypothetical protein [Flavobacteriales bacterium]NQZ35684.1 hypothetical protein [Crocinitomicaceae bacterium]